MKMKTKFTIFINEKQEKNDLEYFLDDVKEALRKFKNTTAQANEFVKMYSKSLKKSFDDGFTVREAIAATKIPGKKIRRNRVSEKFIFDIDDKFEELYEKIENSETKKELSESFKGINNYLQSSYDFSDIKLYERFKNNYKKLIKLYDEKNEI